MLYILQVFYILQIMFISGLSSYSTSYSQINSALHYGSNNLVSYSQINSVLHYSSNNNYISNIHKSSIQLSLSAYSYLYSQSMPYIKPSILPSKMPTFAPNLNSYITHMKFKTDLNILHKFYKHNYNIVKTYFENPRYLENSKVLSFVYDLLVHLTKTFICSNIESIIKKILYEYIISSQNIPIQAVLEQIDLMVNDIENVLYNIIPQKFVRNSVNIYNNQSDEASSSVETVADILNNLIDLLKASSYIDINDITINILKNNIVQYFDTITYKLINNWNVVIENVFLFHINHYRIIECMINIYY